MLARAERDLVDWLGARGDAMLTLLEALVNIDSGTSDLAGVQAVAERIEAYLVESGLHPMSVPRPPRGRGIKVELPGAGDRGVLLMGHLDTVFPRGEAARRPFSIANGRALGPGVADMKAGLVMHCFVLAAFRALGGRQRPLVALFTADEEAGSQAFRPVIEAEAARAAYAFNAEPGRASGNIVIARRGGVFSRLLIEGKAAHAGVDFAAGVSAIDELAHKILALHALTDLDNGVTVNVGVVSGGQSVNTTAPSAEALIDLRIPRLADRDRLVGAIAEIAARSWTPGSSARVEIAGEFAPLVETPAARSLFERYRAAARDLGFAVDAEATGGCADSGFAAAEGAVTLCGLGPVGGGAHSQSEYVEIDSIAPRAQALALTISRLDASENSPRVSAK